MADKQNTTPIVVDEEYKDAIQPVVDNNMRTDILGPHFCRVLENHTPASTAIIQLLATAIAKEPSLKNAIEGVITELDTKRKSRLIDKGLGALGGIALSIIAGVAVYVFTHWPTSNTVPIANTSSTQLQIK